MPCRCADTRLIHSSRAELTMPVCHHRGAMPLSGVWQANVNPEMYHGKRQVTAGRLPRLGVGVAKLDFGGLLDEADDRMVGEGAEALLLGGDVLLVDKVGEG